MITSLLPVFQDQAGKFDYSDLNPAIPVAFLKNSNTVTFARMDPSCGRECLWLPIFLQWQIDGFGAMQTPSIHLIPDEPMDLISPTCSKHMAGRNVFLSSLQTIFRFLSSFTFPSCETYRIQSYGCTASCQKLLILPFFKGYLLLPPPQSPSCGHSALAH